MNPLSDLLRDVLPPAARKYVYAVLALVALVWGIWQASGGDWGQFVAALVASLTGALAASNTPKPAAEDGAQ